MPRSNSLQFQLDGMFEIPTVRRDASALAIHADSGNLWTITDDDVRLQRKVGSEDLLIGPRPGVDIFGQLDRSKGVDLKGSQ